MGKTPIHKYPTRNSTIIGLLYVDGVYTLIRLLPMYEEIRHAMKHIKLVDSDK